jgi:esterase FrsA
MLITGLSMGSNRQQVTDRYLSELKELVQLHARAQGIPGKRCAQILDLIQCDGGANDDAWVNVWSRAAFECEANGDDPGACRYYNLARFPYVNGPDRAAALAKCVVAFERWASTRKIQRVEFSIGTSRVRAWVKTSFPKSTGLLLVFGGIVSIKEQWGELLNNADRLGMTVAITEMPGVGENTLPYNSNSWEMLPKLLEELGESSGAKFTYVTAMSFGGHLAIRAALHDMRIKGIVTVGAPISDFFTRADLWPNLPETTIRTLAHIARVKREDLQRHVASFALTDDELLRLKIPVYYVASRRDEIIPRSESLRLSIHVARARIVEFDDVHGAPRHLTEYKIGIVRALLDMQGRARLRRAALGAVQMLFTARRRLAALVP